MKATDLIDNDQLRDDVPDFAPGDEVKVHVRVVEGSKERVQVFQGNVIGRQGGGLQETYTVRKLSYGVGVEWIPMKPFTLIAEVFGLVGPQGETRGVTQPRFQAGLRITPIDTIDFDVIYGRNILGENANWITLGMNVRFPVPGK